jgi:hypothetical protein
LYIKYCRYNVWRGEERRREERRVGTREMTERDGREEMGREMNSNEKETGALERTVEISIERPAGLFDW